MGGFYFGWFKKWCFVYRHDTIIMDNLIADKKCVPMIIVASSGYAFKDNEYPVFFPGDFDSELVNSIIPYVEENFKVKKGDNESWTSCRHRFVNLMCGIQ